MKKKIIVSGFEYEAEKIIKIFEKKYNWEICLRIGNVVKKNQKYISINTSDLRKGYFSKYNFFYNSHSINKKAIDYCYKYFSNFNETLEDIDGRQFTYHQRLNFFHDNIFFYYDSKKLNPKIIIFWDLPHTTDNYMLYILSNFLNIKVLIHHRIMQLNRSFISSSLDVSKIPKLKNFSNSKLEKYGNYIKNLNKGVISRYKDYKEQEYIANYRKIAVNFNFKRLFNFFETGSAIKKNNKELDKNFFNAAEYEIYRLKSIYKNLKSLHYRKISNFEKVIKNNNFFSTYNPETNLYFSKIF